MRLNINEATLHDLPRVECPRNRVVLARPGLEDDDAIIVTTIGANRSDLGVVVGVGESLPYSQTKSGNWLPNPKGSVVPASPRVGDTVLCVYWDGVGILSADVGESPSPPELRVYGQAIPDGSPSFRDAVDVPWFRGVLGQMENGQFLRMYGDNILVVGDPVKEAEGSILLPDDVKRPSGTGRVALVGDLAELGDIKVGDRICWDITCAKVFEVVQGNRNLYVMRPSAVLYKIPEA